ncbi:ATP-binding protein [Sphingomonas sp.]|jgi:two-component system sensor histidine kinase BaeS|uniref:sensor histidine kinase n=1 Tax=Sphingomonas sp. TaxID=28214 RepID=UPI00307EE89C
MARRGVGNGEIDVRLFRGMFTALAAQALLIVALAGGVLLWNVYTSSERLIRNRDAEHLESFVALAAESAAAGKAFDRIVADLDRRDPAILGNRVALVGEGDRLLAGRAAGPALIERPVVVDGRTIARARIIAPPQLNDRDRAVMRDHYIGIGAILAGILALLLGAAYWFASRWSRPQRELLRLSHEVADGDGDIYFDERGPREIVGTMRNLRRIANRFERIETARRTWLVMIAEELREPIASLGAHLDELQEALTAEPEFKAAIEADQNRLARMAEDLHAVALADLGRLPLRFADVDPRALIHNTIYVHAKRAEAAGVRLETSNLPPYTILVKWDAERIEQLFGALIENSMRYVPRGGRIVLGLESQRDAWRLIVDDNAPGIDVGLAQQLFEPFYRANAKDTPGGSGLSLATARAIVEGHHGRIEASNSPIGGLRITVVLPATPPTA